MRPSMLPRLLTVSLALSALTVASNARAHALDHLSTVDDIGLNKVPNAGTSHILIVPSRVGRDLTDLERFRLEQAYDPEGPPGSFRHFWRTMSKGRYDPIPHLAETVIFDECPIPGRTGANCRFRIEDTDLIFGGAVEAALTDLLERARDEQQLDLSQFDVNGADCAVDGACPDGFFDGVILDTDLYSGVAFPLAALGIDIRVSPTPQPLSNDLDGGLVDGGLVDGGGGIDGGADDAGVVDGGIDEDALSCGIVALVPPDNHEFGHALGLIDLYAGPTVNGLMADSTTSLSAFTRLRFGWGDVTDVTEPGTYTLAPVYDEGTILRFGAPPAYVLVENRAGPLHADVDSSYPGVYIHSVDEDQLPTTELGFIEIDPAAGGKLYFPNESPPYVNVTLPLECHLGLPAMPGACVVDEGGIRDIEHANYGHLGFHIQVVDVDESGVATIDVRAGERVVPDAGPDPEPDPEPSPDGGSLADAGEDPDPDPSDDGDGCSCESTDARSPTEGLALLLAALAFGRRRRRA